MAVITSTLGEGAQQAAGAALQTVLVDLVDLSLVAKQAHWNVVGPRFRAIHLQLDELVDTARTFSDTVAERAVTLGVAPDGRASTLTGSVLAEHPAGRVDDESVVDWFVEALGAVIQRLRDQMAEVEKVDLVTQDLLIQITAELEKARWMFQAERA